MAKFGQMALWSLTSRLLIFSCFLFKYGISTVSWTIILIMYMVVKYLLICKLQHLHFGVDTSFGCDSRYFAGSTMSHFLLEFQSVKCPQCYLWMYCNMFNLVTVFLSIKLLSYQSGLLQWVLKLVHVLEYFGYSGSYDRIYEIFAMKWLSI